MSLDHTATMAGATATVRDSTPVVGLPVQGTKIGKYCLQRELGSGGMGVVYAAFDTDLERVVALKVLHPDGASAGLLREARAMARLAHRNVVTVFEAGSSAGLDYVVMELVDGEPLAEWLHRKPPLGARIDAFLQAGRGLIAAHDAGIVHRDFKPHNVLRAHDGRIAVSDFGLAHDTGETEAGRAGTPGYMAPEQWAGQPATFASDQFAFCVALWEALDGDRPTSDELRTNRLDASALPRALRSILLRGLEADPARRWPSMASLLAAIEATRRRRRLAIVSAAIAVSICAFVGMLLRGEPDAPATPPALDPTVVWNGESRARIAAHHEPAARTIDDVMRRWAMGRVFSDTPAKHACLDAVLVRADVVARMLEASPRTDLRVSQWLHDPASCELPRTPRFALATSPAFRELAAIVFDDAPDRLARIEAVFARGANPCASMIAHVEAITPTKVMEMTPADLATISGEAERCDDDDLRARVAILDVGVTLPHQLLGGRELATKLALADAAVDRVGGARRFELARIHSLLAEFHGDRDGQRAWTRRQIAAMTGPDFADEQIALEIPIATTEQLAVLRVRAAPYPNVIARIDMRRAELAFAGGEVIVSHAERARVRQILAKPESGTSVSGRVLDPRGRPVADAIVACDQDLWGDELSAATGSSPSLRFARTAIDGTFEIPDARPGATVIAELGALRSAPLPAGDALTLTLAPTREITGHVDLAAARREDYRVEIEVDGYELVSPIQSDGSYRLTGVPRKHVSVRLVSQTQILDLDEVAANVGPTVSRADLAIPRAHRAVHVIVRSPTAAGHTTALALVVPGTITKLELSGVMEQQFSHASGRIAREPPGDLPAEVSRLLRPGDLYTLVPGAPVGEASVCAIGLPPATQLARMNDTAQSRNKLKVALRCVSIPATDVIVIEAPMVPRLD